MASDERTDIHELMQSVAKHQVNGNVIVTHETHYRYIIDCHNLLVIFVIRIFFL